MSKATVVAMGNTNTCSYCRALDAVLAKADMQALMPGATFVFADQAKNSSLYAEWKKRAKMSGDIPVIAVFDADGALKGKFVARNTTIKPFTAARIVAEIEKLCPDCCVGGGCGDSGDNPVETCGGCTCGGCGNKVRFCPSCGKEL